MSSNRIQVIPQHSSQQEDDDLSFIVQKTTKNLRKLSDMYIEESSQNNFCFKHDAQTFTVMRVYINSLNNPQIRLYYSKFTPKRKIGAICIIHGYGESSDDYIQTATYFAKQGFVVNMIDLRGFGYSGGFRVNNSIKSTLSDIQNLLKRCCQNGLPTYLLCHGYGCLLAFSLLEQNPNLPLSGVIALSPLFSFPNVNQNSIFHQMALMMSPSIFDDVLINNKINPTGLTNNPLKIKKIVDGVFNFQYVTLKMFKQYNQLSQKTKRDSIKFNYPLLICLGTNDFIQNPKQAEAFIQKVTSKQRQIIYFQNGYHQLYNDINNQSLFHNIQAWIMAADSKKNQVLWNSGKCGTFNYDVKSNKTYLKKTILYLVGILLAIIALVKKLKKCFAKCSAI